MKYEIRVKDYELWQTQIPIFFFFLQHKQLDK